LKIFACHPVGAYWLAYYDKTSNLTLVIDFNQNQYTIKTKD
jgi:hypothetical protein